jgi:thiol-disulfide isomerase/thioredoxin
VSAPTPGEGGRDRRGSSVPSRVASSCPLVAPSSRSQWPSRSSLRRSRLRSRRRRPGSAATQYAIGPADEGLAVGQRPPHCRGRPGRCPDAGRALDGRAVSLEDLQGRSSGWTWASWCPPCRAEHRSSWTCTRHRDDGLEILGLSVQESSAEDVRRYVETYGVGYPIVGPDRRDLPRMACLRPADAVHPRPHGVIRSIVRAQWTRRRPRASSPCCSPRAGPSCRRLARGAGRPASDAPAP